MQQITILFMIFIVNLFSILFFFILGTIVGSFLNVVILRINTGKGFGGRSQCLTCNRTLSWKELIPVVSFFLQKGRCAKCHTKISVQYPIVETITGILFVVTSYFVTSNYELVLWLLVVSLMVIISGYDVLHRMIPVVPMILLALITWFLGFHILGLVIAIPFFLIWVLSAGTWMGLGDVELIAIIGIGLGVSSGVSAVILAFWIACAVMLPIMYVMKKRKKKRNPEIPFGPFLLLGMYLVAVCGLDILKLVTNAL